MSGAAHPYDDLKAYCDGELTPARRWLVRLHLARCAACREEITFMEQLGNELRPDSDVATLDPDLRERVLTEAANLPRISPAPEPLLPKLRTITLLQGAMAGGFVLVLYVLLFPVFFKARERARDISTDTQVASRPAVDIPDTSAPLAAVPPPLPNLPPQAPTVADKPVVAAKPVMVAPKEAYSRMSAPAAAQEQRNAVAGISAQAAAPPGAGLDAIGEDPLRRVHKEATLTVQVTDPEAKSDEVAQITHDIGGYVGSNNLSTDNGGAKSADLVLNVPEPQFEAFIARVEKLGIVTAKQVTGEDITQKVSDADQAQQVLGDETQRAEARLQQLGRHSKWDDAEEARDLRIQLAQARARLVLLKKMALLSTVTVTLTEKPKPAAPVQTGFLSGLHDTSQQALQSLGSSVGLLMSVAIWILAYAPIWIPGILIWRWAHRTLSARRDAGTNV